MLKKFRIWHKEKKVMLTGSLEFWLRAAAETGINPFTHGEWMQFTGLKDKHGKEIFEGDILETHENKVVVCEWDSCRWFFEQQSNRKKLYSLGWDAFYVESYSLNKKWEIIGNIYESPNHDLTTKKNKEKEKSNPSP